MYFIHISTTNGQGLADKVKQKTHKEIVKKPCDMNESPKRLSPYHLPNKTNGWKIYNIFFRGKGSSKKKIYTKKETQVCQVSFLSI